jgi:hypothetical protein
MTQSGDNEKFDTERLLSEWRWLCPQALTVVGQNVFGDLFLRDEAGKVHMLNVGSGEFTLVAESVAEFTASAKDPGIQEEWFGKSAATAAKERGLVPRIGECIGFSTPTVFAESDRLNSAYVVDLYEHTSFLGDIHRQLAALPDGTPVRLVVKNHTDL